MAKLPLYRASRRGSYLAFPADYVHVGDALVDDHLYSQLLASPRIGWGKAVRPHTSYAVYKTKVAGRTCVHYLHRVAYELAHGPTASSLEIDHIDGDGLNNLLSNLRLASQAQQVQNTRKRRTFNGGSTSSSFKGVSKNTAKFRTKPWQSQINPQGGHRAYLGMFSSEFEAAHAYNVGASALFGVHASLNAIPSNSLTPLDEARIEFLVRRKLGLAVTP